MLGGRRSDRMEDAEVTITREDIEAKANELVSALDQTAQSAKSKAMAGAVVVGLVVVAAFVIGRRRGSKSKTIVEVYRA